MKKIITCLLACLFLTACRPGFTLTKDSIFARPHTPGIEIVESGGADGPFVEVMGIVGHPDQGVGWTSSDGRTKIQKSAVAGHYFQIELYKNKKEEFFWIILKIPDQR